MDKNVINSYNSRSLRKVLKEHLGEESVPEDATRDDLFKLIDNLLEAKGWTQEDLTNKIRAAKGEVAPDVDENSVPSELPGDDSEVRYEIMIHPKEGELDYVFIGNNGRDIQIQREVRTFLRKEDLEILDAAVIEMEEKNQLGEVIKKQKVPRFSYSLYGRVLTNSRGKLIRRMDEVA